MNDLSIVLELLGIIVILCVIAWNLQRIADKLEED